MTLSEKERKLLEDEKKQEELCVEKYTRYEQAAKDPQLKNLFKTIGQSEQQHLNTVNQILSGTVPAMNPQQPKKPAPQFTAFYTMGSQDKSDDCYMCTDALSTEKYVSSTYDTTIFESKDTSVRDALNHIQKEEQEHGEHIYNYMAANAMYN